MENQKNMQNSTETDGMAFSQEDVNRMIDERLSEEKAKIDTENAQKERDFEQRELLLSAQEMLNNKGLPLKLADALNCTDLDAVTKSIELIAEIFQNQSKDKVLNIDTGSFGVHRRMSSFDGDEDFLRGAMKL